MTRWLPWVVTLLACGVAAWSWLRGSSPRVALEVAQPEPASVPAPATAAQTPSLARGLPAPEPALPQLQATQVCLDRLEVAHAALDRCRGSTPAALALDEASACLDRPGVATVVEQRIEQALLEHVESERELDERARDRQRSAFDEWAGQALALSPKESEWVEAYVCTVFELRARTLASLEDGVSAAEALAQLKGQRSQLIEDMLGMLGEERYAELRSIGGLSLIASISECP